VDEAEDLGPEPSTALRQVYLITFSHPKKDNAADGAPLRPPGELTRVEIRTVLLEALEATQGPRKSPLKFKQIVVFQERHASGEVHYHVALLAARQFRFAPLKLWLLKHRRLATHWSTKHEFYASVVSYGYLRSPKKQQEELDATPHLWAQDSVLGHAAALAYREPRPRPSLAVAKKQRQNKETPIRT
jgi:hypothetical protein